MARSSLTGEVLVAQVITPALDGVLAFQRLRVATGDGRPDANVIGDLPPVRAGHTYRFQGTWKDDPKYGRQLRATSAVPVVAAGDGPAGLVRYLALTCPGVGEVTARILWQLYGAEAAAVLRSDPERVAWDQAMRPEDAQRASNALRAAADREEAMIGLLDLFGAKGYGERCARACFDRMGRRAAEFVRRNPLTLLVRRLPGCGWKRASELYKETSGRADRPQKLAALHLTSWLADNSDSTWYFAKPLLEMVGNYAKLPGGEPLPGRLPPRVFAGRMAERWRGVRVCRDPDPDKHLVALERHAADEDRGAEYIAEILTWTTNRTLAPRARRCGGG